MTTTVWQTTELDYAIAETYFGWEWWSYERAAYPPVENPPRSRHFMSPHIRLIHQPDSDVEADMTKRTTKRRWKRAAEESDGRFRIRKDYRSPQAIVDQFNLSHPVGSQVLLTTDSGRRIVTIWHPATVLEGHTAVGWFNEISGCYAIAGRVQRIENTSGPDIKTTIVPPAAKAATNSGDGVEPHG